MSRRIARAVTNLVKLCTAWQSPFRRAMTRSLVAEYLEQAVSVETPAGSLSFVAPSSRALHDPWQFVDHEPDTLEWINGIPAGAVFWDIGAHIGMYSVYAAKLRNLQVTAFEPSSVNYATLIRNLQVNAIDGAVRAYCLALSNEKKLDFLNMTHLQAGHSNHAFGQTRTIDGEITPVFRQPVPGMTVDGFIDYFGESVPEYIKLDVDSIELEILKGASRTLRNGVRNVLVEIDGMTREEGGGGIPEFLEDHGFRDITDRGRFPNSRNRIFARD